MSTSTIATMTASTPGMINGDENETNNADNEPKSLVIPIRSSASAISSNLFIEIFPEEISSIPSSTLTSVLREEDASLNTWSDAALLYMLQKRERDCVTLLSTACTEFEAQSGNREERVRVLASAGIGYLTQANRHGTLGNISFPGMSSNKGGLGSGGKSSLAMKNSSLSSATPQQRAASDQNEELRSLADDHFTRASKVDQLFPMTWIGRGMLNLSIERVDQARFFFETTLKQCGQVLPALLGMACVKFKEKDFEGSMEMYGQAMTLFPHRSGAAARVGFGFAAYKLGQVDRARAAFQRAYELDKENVEAMIGIAILDMSSLDETLNKDYKPKVENAIKLISMANLIDHSNAMVQNHLANHYFWKWTPVTGFTVNVEKGSIVVKGSGPVTLDAGERIRIGHEFETIVIDDDQDDDDHAMDVETMTFKIKDPWKLPSAEGLKLWKKDYDRVIALAKGAYSSTTVQHIQAESLFILARVYHVKDEMENAHKFYDRACKLAPDLSPARFGLAQTLIWDETYDEAAAHLRLVLGTSSAATDAHAALGLLEVKAGKDRREAFSYLKKAIDLDPLNPDLVLLEALALQQHESDYPVSLERYRKAVRLMENQGVVIPWEVLTNMGVLCHETKKYDDASEYYARALQALDKDGNGSGILEGMEDGKVHEDLIRHDANKLFWNYVDTGITVESPNARTLSFVISEGVMENSLKTGDHVQIGKTFYTEILDVDGSKIKIKDIYSPIPGKTDSTEEHKNGEEDEEKSSNVLKIFIKKANQRLSNSSAISVAFNLARLHEAAGRIIPAVELHKAIVKRHPTYVNSYLRLACIARDCGHLRDCSEWLKCAVAVAPGNPEVLTLVGNLHLSLCDWAPAQGVFDQLLKQKVPNVEAYSMLCLGNIFFNNLKTPGKYLKHLQHAANWYKRILGRDTSNAYAANGIGTVLAEKGELLKAKEAFNRVREISGDTIPDALLNLGHIYLAQKKHPEALQMYQSYMNRSKNSDAPITSKNQSDDSAEVLLYVAFAYFDWARQTELFNNAKAAPADERYKKCIEYIELAIKKSEKENVILRYNWCMAKLQSANCVLQKLTRNIRRTAQEVQEALDGLEESLPMVQKMIQWKLDGKRINIGTSTLNDFVAHCKANIESAKSHLSQELKKEAEAREMRELQRIEAESLQKKKEMEELRRKEKEAKEQEDRDNKAKRKMEKVNSLVAGWEQEAKMKEDVEIKKKTPKQVAPEAEDGLFDSELPADKALFDDSGDESNGEGERKDGKKVDNGENDKTHTTSSVQETTVETQKDLFGDSDDDDEEEKAEDVKKAVPVPVETPVETQKDLFGDSSDESDEELLPSSKRDNSELGENDDDDEGQANKKRRVLSEDSD